ncbi:MAG: heavy metal sensor histidine kinase [Moraxellaceae bacterium]|nr:heavy metal sensor histidine kinase [Moraxellaceae bacterium]
MTGTGATRPRSLTFRLTALFTLASTTVLLVLGAAVAWAVNAHFIEQDMDSLTGKLHLVQHAFAQVDGKDALARLPEQLDNSLIGHHGLAVTVFDRDGRAVFATEPLALPPDMTRDVPAQGYKGPLSWEEHANASGQRGGEGDRQGATATHAAASAQGERHFRGIVARMGTAHAGAGSAWADATVVIATEISHHEDFMRAFLRSMSGVIVVAAVLMGLLGWGVTRRGLAPLHALRDSAAGVTAARLDQRLPTDAVPVEMVEMVDSLNAMLARLEDSFRRLSDFSSDIAHELRTPVSNLMMQTQVALSRARSADDYREVLSSNAEELERLSRMISDMLFLAQADNGLMLPHAEPVSLATEVAGLFEFYEALAESAGLRLHSEGDASVTADRLMLRRALSNLLSNALRHARAGSTVQVTISQRDGEASVCVRNEGDTIPAAQAARLFDRFYRADAARVRAGGGSNEGAGLGLAITRSIAQAHGGDIRLASADGVTRFFIVLPTATP